MVTIDRERLISEKQNNKASAKDARIPKEAMLLRDIDAFRPFGLISKACQGPRGPPNSINVGFYKKQANTKLKTYVLFTFERGSF